MENECYFVNNDKIVQLPIGLDYHTIFISSYASGKFTIDIS